MSDFDFNALHQSLPVVAGRMNDRGFELVTPTLAGRLCDSATFYIELDDRNRTAQAWGLQVNTDGTATRFADKDFFSGDLGEAVQAALDYLDSLGGQFLSSGLATQSS